MQVSQVEDGLQGRASVGLALLSSWQWVRPSAIPVLRLPASLELGTLSQLSLHSQLSLQASRRQADVSFLSLAPEQGTRFPAA